MPDEEKEAFLRQYNAASFVDKIGMIMPDLVEALNAYHKAQKLNIQESLSRRLDKQERADYLHQEIKKIRERLDNDMLSKVHLYLTGGNTAFLKEGASLIKGLGDLAAFLPPEAKSLGEASFISSLTKLVSFQSVPSSEDLFSVLRSISALSPAISEALKSEDPTKAVLALPMFVHFEKQYLSFLIELYNQSVQVPSAVHEKIEWLGTQKELGELFIELHRKGWIKEIKPNLISGYFDKSETINEILKPAQDRFTKQPTYEKIFTSRYKRMFENIAPRPIKPKDK